MRAHGRVRSSCIASSSYPIWRGYLGLFNASATGEGRAKHSIVFTIIREEIAGVREVGQGGGVSPRE